MGPLSLKKEILERIDGLPHELQRKLLDFLNSLTQELPKGIPGKQLLRFAGCISQEDLQTMKEG